MLDVNRGLSSFHFEYLYNIITLLKFLQCQVSYIQYFIPPENTFFRYAASFPYIKRVR